MNSIIEQILLVTFPREVYVTELLSIAVYRMRKKGNWYFCIVTGRNSETLPMEFDGLEAFWSDCNRQKWDDN